MSIWEASVQPSGRGPRRDHRRVAHRDGLQDLIVALAAKKSLAEKRTVKISEIQLPAAR